MTFFTRKISIKILGFTITTVLLTAGILTYVCLSQFRAEMIRQANAQMDSRLKVFWELLKAKGADFSIVDGD